MSKRARDRRKFMRSFKRTLKAYFTDERVDRIVFGPMEGRALQAQVVLKPVMPEYITIEATIGTPIDFGKTR